MKKTCSRIISLILSLTVLCSMFIGFGTIEGVAADEKIADFKFLNYITINGESGQTANKQGYDKVDYARAHAMDVAEPSTWNTNFQIDFGEYADCLKEPTIKLEFTVRTGTSSGSNGASSLIFYALDDIADKYFTDKGYDITFEEARDTYQLYKASADGLVATFAPTSNAVNQTVTIEITDEGKEAILKKLNAGTDKIVTFTVKTANSNANYFRPGHNDTKLTMTRVDVQPIMEEVAKGLTWEALSDGQEISSVTKDLKLPTKINGVDISWSSTDNLIDSDGTIHPSKDTELSTTLTAQLSYGGVAYTGIPVSFNIKLAEEELLTYTVDFNLMVQVSSLSADEKYQTVYTNYFLKSFAMGDTTSDVDNPARGDCLVFMKWDLANAKKYIDVAESLSLNIGNRNTMGNTGIVSLLNDSSDDWDGDITYNQAIAKGMYTDPGLFTKGNVAFNVSKTVIDDEALLTGIKKAIDQDPKDGIITFRLSAKDTNQCMVQINGTVGAPYIEIKYYKSELMSDEDYKGSKAGTMTWDAISKQDINNVVADLTLPSTWYGEEIVWTEEHGAIEIAGNVAKVTTGTKTKGNLIATVGGVENKFEVTVSDKNIVLQSERVYKEDGISELNYSNGYIWANEALQGEYTVLLATYNADNELVQLTVKDTSFAINAGENMLYSGCYSDFADATTKVILVNNMTDLTPLAVAK